MPYIQWIFFIVKTILNTFSYCNILTFDPAQKCYSKVMHRKEVAHSNGQ